MIPLAWTLLTVLLWTSGSSHILQQEPVNRLYPKILSTEEIVCDCANIANMSCDSVYWFRSISNHRRSEFLGKCTIVRPTYGANVDSTRFKFISKTLSFTLRIINVTEEDTGIYSCVLKGRKNIEMWKPGTLLLPGVTPPTLPPKTNPKPPVKSVCRCSKKNSSQGCGSLVLWPLVGLIAAIALALICTLYYFSRLPKKCRHHFVKRR
ncbi:T-cell surface glycoprotein CD8 beta chain [Etheostoma spectabile]|uniref:T-cell surface glycoprotein CD8 beta chain n=1 Tax=Etheostoma spectabile TaxID=54343 RepID=UPI0013AFC7BD|nr:T-cell surface glycoprotein CD8 beta chain-like [Etheostoma spectabile]